MDRTYYTNNTTELLTNVTESVYDEIKENFKIKLSKSIFHPKGGGQDSDKGFINHQEILEFLDGYFYVKDEIKINDKILLKIDPEVRLLNSRMHSLGHILAYVVERKNWKAIKAHHYKNDCKIIFNRTEKSIDNIDLEELTSDIKAIIKRNLKQNINIDEKNRRTVSFDEIKYFCGGTHVENTSEIGDFTLTKIKKSNNELTINYNL